jgi:hypothetical protein
MQYNINAVPLRKTDYSANELMLIMPQATKKTWNFMGLIDKIPSLGTLTNIALLVTAFAQVYLGFQFYKVRQAVNTAQLEARLLESDGRAQLKLANIEERFSKVSVVLKFLLDEAKNPRKTNEEVIRDGGTAGASHFSGDSKTLDVPVATVIAERLNLRIGPGLTNAPLMTVSKGTRLVVEDYSSNWARVIAPNGVRAFALKEQLEIAEAAQ